MIVFIDQHQIPNHTVRTSGLHFATPVQSARTIGKLMNRKRRKELVHGLDFCPIEVGITLIPVKCHRYFLLP